MKTDSEKTPFPDPVSPYPGWKRRIYRFKRPITRDDIDAFLGDQELYIRDNGNCPVAIIHKYGLVEIHFIVGKFEAEVWFSPDQEGWASEYLDALVKTRF